MSTLGYGSINYKSYMHGHIQMTNVTNNAQHHSFDAGHAQIVRGLMVAIVLLFYLTTVQNGFHDVDGMFDKLRIDVRYDDLCCGCA